MGLIKGQQLWPKGQSGNPKGRPRNPFSERLREAIITVEEEQKEELMKHLVRKAYKDNKVLMHLSDKLLPTLIETDNKTENTIDLEQATKEFVDDITNRIESRRAEASAPACKDGEVPKQD